MNFMINLAYEKSTMPLLLLLSSSLRLSGAVAESESIVLDQVMS